MNSTSPQEKYLKRQKWWAMKPWMAMDGLSFSTQNGDVFGSINGGGFLTAAEKNFGESNELKKKYQDVKR